MSVLTAYRRLLRNGPLVRLLGGEQTVAALKRPDLRGYVDKRAGEWIDPNVHRAIRRERDAKKKPRTNRKPPPPESEDRPRRHPSAATVRKEIVSLRTAWNWARTQLGLKDDVKLLDQTLEEEKKTDALLSKMAMQSVNKQAA